MNRIKKKQNKTNDIPDVKRLKLICEAIKYCQKVKILGMPASAYSKALREPVHFLWEIRKGSKHKSAQYRSKSAVGMVAKNGNLIYDHSVPFNLLQKKLLSLNIVSPKTVEPLLEKYSNFALILKSEDEKLRAAGYNHKMPEDWDGIDPLARYKAVGIDIVKNIVT